MSKRRRRRNPSGAISAFVHDHPFLFTFFVLPAIVGVPVAIAQAIFRPKEPEQLPPPVDPFGGAQ